MSDAMAHKWYDRTQTTYLGIISDKQICWEVLGFGHVEYKMLSVC